MRCRACGHLYLNPRPLASDLAVIYPSNYYAFAGPGNPLVARLRRRWEGGKVRLYRELVGEGPRRLLDVGCGNGRFLSLLRDFGPPEWQLVGVEFDAAAVAQCRALGFEAHAGRVEDLPASDGSFDAVIMLQLIEHVEDPVAIARSVHRLLRPGGVFIIETPNLGGLDYRLFKKPLVGPLPLSASLEPLLDGVARAHAHRRRLRDRAQRVPDQHVELDDLAAQLPARSRLAGARSCASSTTRTRCCSGSSCCSTRCARASGSRRRTSA